MLRFTLEPHNSLHKFLCLVGKPMQLVNAVRHVGRFKCVSVQYTDGPIIAKPLIPEAVRYVVPLVV